MISRACGNPEDGSLNFMHVGSNFGRKLGK